MTITGHMEERIAVPDKVQPKLADRVLEVKGPKGQMQRHFPYPKIDLKIEGKEIVLSAEMPRKRESAMMGTYVGHITNMLKGVTDGFTYEMKIVYSHFPMKVSVQGKELKIENFLGEEAPRSAKILGDTKVNVKGDAVTLEGPNIEEVGQSAANIEKATKIEKVDLRVFQDGIYIVKKG